MSQSCFFDDDDADDDDDDDASEVGGNMLVQVQVTSGWRLCATTCAKTSGWRRPKVASRDLPATHLDNHLGDEEEVGNGDG